jgi:hypothetical protein
MDITKLEGVSQYLGKVLVPTTLCSYSSGQRRYLAFCRQTNLQPLQCKFAAHLATEGLTHQSIKLYLSAIRHFHIMAGRGDPFIGNAFPLLQYVLG